MLGACLGLETPRREYEKRHLDNRPSGAVGHVHVFVILRAVSAQTNKVNGLITGQNGAAMTLQTACEPKLMILLTDDTRVGQVQGMLKARRKAMSIGALIPGLQVQVEGSYNAENQLAASSVVVRVLQNKGIAGS